MIRTQRSPLKSSRVARRRHRSVLIKAIILFLGVAAFVYCFSWLSYYPSLAIGSVTVSGISDSENQLALQQIASQDLIGGYLRLFSKANMFVYPREKIISDVRVVDPQIATVQASVVASAGIDGFVGGRTLVLSITERQPAYEWCSGPVSATNASSTLPDTPSVIGALSDSSPNATSAITSSPSCYVMDQTGYVFAPSTILAISPATAATSSSPFFRFYGRLDASTTPIGLQYLPATDFQNLTNFISALDSAQNIQTYALIDRADGVDELFLKSSGIIMFDDTENLNTVATDIAALSANSPVFTYGSKLYSLDLRVSNKAFYKLVGATSSTTLGNTATTTAGN